MPSQVRFQSPASCLPGQGQTAKNTLAVGNVYDLRLNEQNQLIYATIDATSSIGPTDDMRVKPELVASDSIYY